MSRFINTATRDVIDVPAALDAMYNSRPEYTLYDPEDGTLEVHPAVTAPAGATGDPVPEFDPASPLAAGPVQALEHIEDIKGAALQESLEALGLDSSGSADDKRARLAERLTEEVSTDG